jgi:hypothetical protein
LPPYVSRSGHRTRQVRIRAKCCLTIQNDWLAEIAAMIERQCHPIPKRASARLRTRPPRPPSREPAVGRQTCDSTAVRDARARTRLGGMGRRFDPDDDGIAVILDRRGSSHASVTAFGDIEEFAQWVPVIVADATACNAFDRYTGALGFLRTLSTSFESGRAWTETTADAMRGYKTAGGILRPTGLPLDARA